MIGAQDCYKASVHLHVFVRTYLRSPPSDGVEHGDHDLIDKTSVNKSSLTRQFSSQTPCDHTRIRNITAWSLGSESQLIAAITK